MSEYSIGVYWHNRELSLKAYSTVVKDYLAMLKTIHPAFNDIYWVGAKPNSEVKILNGLENLDHLIMKNAGNKKHKYSHATADGKPSLESTSAFGYTMFFCTAGSDSEKFVLGIRAGRSSTKLINTATIRFPILNATNATPFHAHDFHKNLLLKLIKFWQPESGAGISHDFSKKISPDQLTDVGWLTYIKNSNASAMRNNPDLIAAGIEMEPVSIGGTLFGIDRAMVSPDNETQVARAQLLRTKLMENHLIES